MTHEDRAAPLSDGPAPEEPAMVGQVPIGRARLNVDPDFSLMPELFPRAVRPHVRAFGRFVRLADGITDNAALNRGDKLARLAALDRGLDGDLDAAWSDEARGVIAELRQSLEESSLPAAHARHILQACRRDAEGGVCDTWADLMVYCQFAAAPIGRHMLSLVHQDLAACRGPADSLCAALRILKQLRDCVDSTVQFNRLCIPRQFLEDAMIAPEHLRAPSAKGQTRAVLDRVLDGVDRLLVAAAPLPGLVRHRGLAIHIAIVLCRARKLVALFRRRDPLRERLGLTTWQRAVCRWLATLQVWARA